MEFLLFYYNRLCIVAFEIRRDFLKYELALEFTTDCTALTYGIQLSIESTGQYIKIFLRFPFKDHSH